MKNDENISEMEYIQDDKTLGIRFLGILEQYIVVNNKNMKELLKNIGYSEEQLSNIPETFEFNTDFYDVLNKNWRILNQDM